MLAHSGVARGLDSVGVAPPTHLWGLRGAEASSFMLSVLTTLAPLLAQLSKGRTNNAVRMHRIGGLVSFAALELGIPPRGTLMCLTKPVAEKLMLVTLAC